MEKAIEIKRRAQRCILNGDLNGALAEYEKLVAIGDPDPYYCVLLADLLYKMGSAHEAQKRYLEAIQGYAKSGLYKNGIAVCKKMSRLSLSPIDVPRALAELYSLDGLTTEACLAYQQLSEVLVKSNRIDEARDALLKAIEITPDAARLYERLGEIEVVAGDNEAAGNAWSDAAERFERAGQASDVRRCRSRIAQLRLPAPPRGSTSTASEEAAPAASAPAGSAPVLTWEPPAAAGEAEPLSIRHTPPVPAEEEVEEEVEGADERGAPVSVVHGFSGFDQSPASDQDEETEDEVEEDVEAAAEEDVEVEDDAAEEVEEVEEVQALEEEPAPVPNRIGAGATPGPAELALAGFDADDYRSNDAPETNGPVAPVEDTESTQRATRRISEPAPRRDEIAPPHGGRGEPGPPHPTPAQPGLAQPVEASGESGEDAGLAQVSLILAEAQACFHAGDREAATVALIRAAQAYDQMGRHDSAVTIYRSLGQSPDVSLQLMMLWLKNCQRRNDREEGARVACELGDRALNDGDVAGAREWFERAQLYDPKNELAPRRLKILGSGAAPAEAAAATQEAASTSVSAVAGHLNVRTERDEPVIVDLGVLIEEFQKAVEPELASDPQGHYDLGMSYREMGLTEQAVQSLRIAAKSPAFRLRAGELAGRCLLDLGRFDEAADTLRATLEAPDLLPSAAVDLRYQLALALEAAGRSAEALAEFERVYAAQANYPDVAMKIRLLRKTAGAA